MACLLPVQFLGATPSKGGVEGQCVVSVYCVQPLDMAGTQTPVGPVHVELVSGGGFNPEPMGCRKFGEGPHTLIGGQILLVAM